MQIDVDAGLVERLLFELARNGAYGETGVWRTAYSPEWVDAQDQIAAWFAEAGLDVRRDAVGSVWGRLAGSERGSVIATGSHIDSQTPGGRYDGALGVVAGLVALRTLREQFGQPRRTLEAVSLCEEEASRFHATNFWGSRAIIGAISSEEPDLIRDRDGTSIGEAMRSVGLDPQRIPEASGAMTSIPGSSSTSSRARSWKRTACRWAWSTQSRPFATTWSNCAADPTTPVPDRWREGSTRWQALRRSSPP